MEQSNLLEEVKQVKSGERILYISTVEDGRPYQGVKKKIGMQCNAFRHIGLEVTAINSGRRSLYGQIEKLLPFSYGINYRDIKAKISKLERDSFRYCYVRYSPATRGLIDVFRIIKETQKDIKIVLEIPTYPYEDEFKSLKSKPSMMRERLFRNRMKKYVDLVVTPSHLEEKKIFGIPALEITNGIDAESISARNYVPQGENTINLIGVALITPKQGYDRVIRGLNEYIKTKQNDEPNVYFYIIGTGATKKELEDLSNQLNLGEHVFFTGEKDGTDLEYYYSIGDLGVGTLGLYKTKELMKVNSLKTREYCAKGLPFIITDCDYKFADSNEDFFMVIEDSEKPVDVRESIQFLKLLHKKYSNEEIVSKMTSFAKKNLSWSTIMRNVINTVDNQ